MTNKITWDSFYKEFVSNHYIYDLIYKDNVYTLGSEKKTMVSKWTWFLASQHTYNTKSVYLSFNSPQELLDKATIEGKSLKSIWNDISLN